MYLALRRKSLFNPILVLSGCLAMAAASTALRTFAQEERPELDSRPPVTVSDLLPDSTVIQLTAEDVGPLVATLLNHPLRQRLESLPGYETVWRSADFAKLKAGVALFAAAMGKPWNEAIGELAAGGISLSVDSADGGVAVLARSSSQEMLERLRDFVLSVVQHEASSDQQVSGNYRGFDAFLLSGEWKMALVDDWLLVTNRSELGKRIIDNYVDRPTAVLRANDRYQKAMAELVTSDLVLNGFANIKAIRETGAAQKLFQVRTDNPFAELLLGGVLSNLQRTPYAVASIHLNDTGARLRVATVHQADWESPREYFFGSPQGAAPPLLEVADRLFAVSTYRDISQMWLRAGDLMTDKAVDDLAKADTQLTTLFSGRDFGEDVLGAFTGAVQLVGKPQEFSGGPIPAIQLPAFALRFRMKHPEASEPELRRVFQSLIGFLNIVGAMEGQPQFDLGMEVSEDARVYFATYVPDRDNPQDPAAPINYNFSPTVAFRGEWFVLSSAASLARELVSDAQPEDGTVDESLNTVATLDASSLKQLLGSNKDQLVAQNMLEKGHELEAAESEIGLLLELVDLLSEVDLKLRVTEDHLELEAEVNLND